MLHGAGYLPTVTTMEHMAYIPMIIPIIQRAIELGW